MLPQGIQIGGFIVERPSLPARPKLMKPCRKTLTHHLPSHPPIRITRHAGCTQRSPSPPHINLVQDGHDPGRIGRLGNRGQVIYVLPADKDSTSTLRLCCT